MNGVIGYQVDADNGNSIFIPAAGFREDDVLREVGSSANYWSSTADTEYPDYAWYFFTKKNRYVGEYLSVFYRPISNLRTRMGRSEPARPSSTQVSPVGMNPHFSMTRPLAGLSMK